MNLVNHTRLPADLAIVYDARGRERLLVVVKVNGRLRAPGEEPAEPLPIHRADVLSPSGALRYPSDFALGHPGTDVICHGRVHSPGGKPCKRSRAELRVGDLRAAVIAFGPRRWERRVVGLSVSEPEPFTFVPLGFEQAFGGPQSRRNPVGTGDLTGLPASAREGVALPCLEREDALISGPGDQPAPAGFGAVAPGWEPRILHAGTYDEAWRARRAPLLPLNFDERFHRVANDGLSSERPLRGGEPVELVGLTVEGRLVTALPRAALGIRVGGPWLRPELALVVIEPDEGRVALTYRASVDITGRIDSLPQIHVIEKNILTRGPEEG
jgi:hypothetical protein